MTTDLTEGPPLRMILRLAFPMLIGGFFQLFYNVADMLVVGRVNGSRDLAAIGATASATFLILSITLGLATASSIVMAQHFGARNRRLVRVTLASTLYLTLACGLAMTVVGLLCSRALLEMMGTPPEILDRAAEYMIICVGAGGFGATAYNSASAALRAVGDSRTPLAFLILASLLNIAMDLVLVAGLGLGVAGAAAATVFSQVVSAALCVVYIASRYPVFRLTRADLHPDWDNIRTICRLGLSLGLQGLFIAVGEMTILGVVNRFGADSAAAYSTALRIQQFAIIVFFAFTEALAVFAGQNLGARRFDRIRDGFRKIAALVLGVSLISAAASLAGGGACARLFINPEDRNLDAVAGIAGEYLRVAGCLYPFLGLIIIHNNILRGLGDTFHPLLSGLVELFAKSGLALILADHFGRTGVWFAAPIGWILGMIPPCLGYHRGGWEKLAGTLSPPPAASVRLHAESGRFLPK